MARNLRKAGFPLTVYNRTREKAERLVETGAQVADTAALAVAGATVVLSMLADDDASRESWLGPSGALAAMQAGSVVVECGTVSPDWINHLHQEAAARGLQMMDAPVTGSRTQAHAGELTFLVGADATTLERVRPVLESMSKAVINVGPVGSGALLKLINNFLCGVQAASFAEALAWIERTSLDRAQALQFLNGGAAGSNIFKAMSERMTARTYEVNFLLRLMEKDLRYAQHAAAAKEIELTTAACSRTLFEQAEAEGYGERDMAAIVEVLRSKNEPQPFAGEASEQQGIPTIHNQNRSEFP
jgi:3-hydroxyisobutyrate dehydrogenase